MIGKAAATLGKAAVSYAAKMAKDGKADIPRFLYHITTRKNYASILKTGHIKTSADICPASNLNGVFMFDLKNFAKRWTSTFIDFGEDFGRVNLGSGLLFRNSDIVLLKIPTKNFDINKLRVRIQDETNIGYHALNGDSARFQSLYTRRKKPIEYIYGQNINISDVKKIGEIDLAGLDRQEAFKSKPFDILLKLFKGNPEEKCIEAFKNAKVPEKVVDMPVF